MSGLIITISIAIVIYAGSAQASSCKAYELLNHPDLEGNSKFLEEFALLPDASPQNIEKLIEKHAPSLSAKLKADTPRSAGVPKQTKVRLGHKAEKDIEKMGKNANRALRKNFDSFVEIMSDPERGLKELYANPGKWRLEHISGGNSSVRLNHGYRVVFHKRDDASFEIVEITKEGMFVH